MSNLQVTCVDVCQRSRNVPTTYGQSYAQRVSHTLAYGEKFQAWKICQTARRTTTYASMLLTYTNLPITYSTCASVLAKFFIRQAYVGEIVKV